MPAELLSQIPQLIVSGVMVGMIYALLGLGLVVTYTTTRIVNVAIGEFAMIATLTAASLAGAGIPLPLAVVAGLMTGTLVGWGVYETAMRPLLARQAPVLSLLILSIAVHLILKGSGLIVWGTEAYKLPAFSEGPPLVVGSAVLTRQGVWIIAAGIALMVALWLGFTRTLRGKALVASAVNPVGARLMGIRVLAMGRQAFVLSALLASAAGILIAPQTLADYDMGLMLGLKGFVGAVLGGFRHYPWVVAGCMALGIAESLVAGLLPSGYRDAIAFLLLIAVLVARAVPVLRHGVLAAEEAAQE
ncbi:inner-membrane translocator [Thermaerobacter marianensis DSM 12885]|uniref:Inner-membrane translocator n=1 Tax=Thermaerobacter marianensis (strain ATCC 700841 / DSM 12885 / JCM 10246 / 7p75a) TaxID=644966 RepID=E6SIA6_THEM7|nr:branched-chain amino acid ABC transporter permease [Thermaerobacter marianensis]ADU51917.1 inner-membrane translocator [Thermaerobacter marianensis DSM 12885]